MLKQLAILLIFSFAFAKCLNEFETTEQRIAAYGYPTEKHVVTTEDGYKLTLFRIPYSPKLNNSANYRPAVFLQHGFQSNSDCFVCNGPDNAIAYLLADGGFDVWLGNTRGNTYSRENVYLSPSQSEFWNFNWNEVGMFDVAAMIDYVLQNTDQKALHYIAHSQGTSAYLILVSSRPDYNHKIKTAHLLAPCAFYENSDAPQLKYAAPIIASPYSVGYNLFKNFELLPSNSRVSRMIDVLCGGDNINSWCSPIFKLAIDSSNSHTNQSAFGVLLGTNPAGCSSNQVIHNAQMYDAKRFCKYDYGIRENQNRYSQSSPPDYDLKQIITNTYLYASSADTTCTAADAKILNTKMGKVASFTLVPDDEFSHLDFVIGLHVKKYINDPVIKICQDYEKNLNKLKV